MNENNLEPRNVHDSSHHTHSWTIISLKMELRLIKHILSPCNHLVVDDNQTTAMAKLSYNSQTWGYQNPRMEVEDSSRGIEEKDKASLH